MMRVFERNNLDDKNDSKPIHFIIYIDNAGISIRLIDIAIDRYIDNQVDTHRHLLINVTAM